jgi:hypothetical protein
VRILRGLGVFGSARVIGCVGIPFDHGLAILYALEGHQGDSRVNCEVSYRPSSVARWAVCRNKRLGVERCASMSCPDKDDSEPI